MFKLMDKEKESPFYSQKLLFWTYAKMGKIGSSVTNAEYTGHFKFIFRLTQLISSKDFLTEVGYIISGHIIKLPLSSVQVGCICRQNDNFWILGLCMLMSVSCKNDQAINWIYMYKPLKRQEKMHLKMSSA